MKLIRTTVKKSTRARYVPETPFWKGKTPAAVKSYVTSILDDRGSDKSALKRRGDY